MKSKKVKKVRKLKFSRVLILIIILFILYLSFNYFLNSKIKNIYVKGNSTLTDQEIIELAKIDNYPSFYWTSSATIKERLLKSPFIKEVKVEKRFYHKIVIKVTEHKMLFYKKENGKLVLSNKKELVLDDIVIGIPLLINYVPDTKYDKFIREMSNIKTDILNKVSEIEYVPNEYDKDRFLFYMNDTNRVYLTLNKFDKINSYDDVLPELEGKKGILYFDSGNHFQAY